MIPGIHYPSDEQYNESKNCQCPHCGYTHKCDISFYKRCVECGKSMKELKKEV